MRQSVDRLIRMVTLWRWPRPKSWNSLEFEELNVKGLRCVCDIFDRLESELYPSDDVRRDDEVDGKISESYLHSYPHLSLY